MWHAYLINVGNAHVFSSTSKVFVDDNGLTSYDDHHGLSVSTLQSNMDTYGMLTESQMDILFSITQSFISQNEKTNIDIIFMVQPKFKHFSLGIQLIYFNVKKMQLY